MSVSGYAFGDDADSEQRRLVAVQRALDGPTQAALIEVGVQAGWRCWEIGAGQGSIARWLGQMVGSDGHVVASDLDHRWLVADAGNVQHIRHDVTRDPLPGTSFDLVHARLVLEHLADPSGAIVRLTGALRAGGALVLEDSVNLQIKVTPPNRELEGLAGAWERAGPAVGWNPLYGAKLIDDLTAAGLTGMGGREYRVIAPGGDAWVHLGAGLDRLRVHLADQGIGENELARALTCLHDPGSVITGPPIAIAWGRRAG